MTCVQREFVRDRVSSTSTSEKRERRTHADLDPPQEPERHDLLDGEQDRHLDADGAQADRHALRDGQGDVGARDGAQDEDHVVEARREDEEGEEVPAGEGERASERAPSGRRERGRERRTHQGTRPRSQPMSQQMLTLMMPDAVSSTTPVTRRPILEWARSLPM